nr:UDP-N-acetylmuramoyl-L-alanine--D-glutamate ligase [Helcococcus sueciensis]
MEIRDKKILVFGLGISGKSSVKALSNLGAKVLIFDDREYEELREDVYSIDEYEFDIIQEDVDIPWSELYCVLKSPGIKLKNGLIQEAVSRGVEVITDIELAYRLYGGDKFISITGTNGKTTVTSAIAHILEQSGEKVRVVGNIGVGLLSEIYNYGLDYTYVVEVSSFQLESIRDFRSKISIITNITPDHLDWHGNFENYINAKKNIYKNIKEDDYLILNKDDEILNKINVNANVKYFSIKEKSDCYYDGEYIINAENKFERDIINLVGDHNVSNILSAILACNSFGLKFNQILEGIKTFKSIEHRIEFVSEIDGVKYYNDSKGTNIDSTKKALSGFKKNVILIAGGYDKKIEFDELFEDTSNIKYLISLGETAQKINEAAKRNKVLNSLIVKDLDEAMEKAFDLAEKGDVVLLSPACASWGIYKNYIERGNHFKNIVYAYEKKKEEK